MNKITFLIALFLCVGIWGCEDKEDNKNCTNYTEQEKSKKYEWFIDSFGDEEGAGIIKQAKHFKISKVDREKGTYYYQPQDEFVGKDSVEIEVSKGSDGASRGDITLYKIKFEITECGMKVSKSKTKTTK